jgi:hypothetical protein
VDNPIESPSFCLRDERTHRADSEDVGAIELPTTARSIRIKDGGSEARLKCGLHPLIGRKKRRVEARTAATSEGLVSEKFIRKIKFSRQRSYPRAIALRSDFIGRTN